MLCAKDFANESLSKIYQGTIEKPKKKSRSAWSCWDSCLIEINIETIWMLPLEATSLISCIALVISTRSFCKFKALSADFSSCSSVFSKIRNNKKKTYKKSTSYSEYSKIKYGKLHISVSRNLAKGKLLFTCTFVSVIKLIKK